MVEETDTEILIEEFVDGPEVSVETVSWKGVHHVIAITDKLTTGDPHWVELGHSQPTRLPLEVQRSVRRCVEAGLDALGIVDSPSHVEIKVGSHGPVLIEIGARLGGDFISTDLTLLSTGISMPRAAIDTALGREPDVSVLRSGASAIRYLTARPGVVSAVRGVEDARSLSGVETVAIYVKPGDRVGVVRASGDRAGHVIASGRQAEEAVAIAEQVLDAVEIEMVVS
jgi:biotin carboxylase